MQDLELTEEELAELEALEALGEEFKQRRFKVAFARSPKRRRLQMLRLLHRRRVRLNH